MLAPLNAAIAGKANKALYARLDSRTRKKLELISAEPLRFAAIECLKAAALATLRGSTNLWFESPIDVPVTTCERNERIRRVGSLAFDDGNVVSPRHREVSVPISTAAGETNDNAVFKQDHIRMPRDVLTNPDEDRDARDAFRASVADSVGTFADALLRLQALANKGLRPLPPRPVLPCHRLPLDRQYPQQCRSQGN